MRIACGVLLVLGYCIVALTVPCFGDTSALIGSFGEEDAMVPLDSGDFLEKAHPKEADREMASGGSAPLFRFSQSGVPEEKGADFYDVPEGSKEEDLIADPLEPLNRVFFLFNDKLYFWLLKPVATGYEKVVPELLRVSVRNFFSNLSMPIRAVNCLLQGKIKAFGNELVRFMVNTSGGMCGLVDVAKAGLNLPNQEEDLGQTLGFAGIGPGIFINWPILGPSSLRDTIGLIGDGFLDPVNYLVPRTKYNAAVRGYDMVNGTSLVLGDYEALKRAALDPYVALRDAYHQHRQHKVKE
jgi:phospholipid-binding lipoprotein MlaA